MLIRLADRQQRVTQVKRRFYFPESAVPRGLYIRHTPLVLVDAANAPPVAGYRRPSIPPLWLRPPPRARIPRAPPVHASPNEPRGLAHTARLEGPSTDDNADGDVEYLAQASRLGIYRVLRGIFVTGPRSRYLHRGRDKGRSCARRRPKSMLDRSEIRPTE
jgi:hypothetical protein